ncbi:hypothetical protein B0H13DRAFT_2428766 [Mycena leptocephala]|nr:hypothetical protein B0H13DRAFT_2428766 [Mycena leptocephala]
MWKIPHPEHYTPDLPPFYSTFPRVSYTTPGRLIPALPSLIWITATTIDPFLTNSLRCTDRTPSTSTTTEPEFRRFSTDISLDSNCNTAPFSIEVSPRLLWGISSSSYRLTLSTISTAIASDVWDSGTVASAHPYLVSQTRALRRPTLVSDSVYLWTVAHELPRAGRLARERVAREERDRRSRSAHERLHVRGADLSAVAWPDAAQRAAVGDCGRLYANGALVGSALNTTDLWKSAHIFHSLLFSALVTFSNGSSALLSSSTSTSTATGARKATTSIPANFQRPGASDTSWPSSVSLETYGVAPWDASVVVALPTAPTPSLTAAIWIWDAAGTASDALAGQVAYRDIEVIMADDLFVLWVDGVQVGTAPNETDVWEVASMLSAPFGANMTTGSSNGDVLFAVLTTNRPDATSDGASPAGLVASIIMRLVIDGSWKVIEGPTRLDDVFGGENYDGGQLRPKGTLGRARQLPTRVVGNLTPASITEPVPGCVFLILYLGREPTFRAVLAADERAVAAWVRLTVSGPKGAFPYFVLRPASPIHQQATHTSSSSTGPVRRPHDVHSIPTDCPTFEKNGSGDAMIATIFLMNFDSGEVCAGPAGLARGQPAGHDRARQQLRRK